MTKEEARFILENHITNQICRQVGAGISPHLNLPKTNEIYHSIHYDDNLNFVFEQWSFKELIKIAYDLEDKKI